MKNESFDVIIVGGGIVGLTLGLALAKASTLSVAILESSAQLPSWEQYNYHHRVSAITLASRKVFANLDVWQAIANKRISPFQQIAIWDEGTHAALQFKAEEIAERYLGYIVENNLIQSELLSALKNYPQVKIIYQTKLQRIHNDVDELCFFTEHGDQYHCQLAVASDGAKSWLRNQAQIAVAKTEYQQSAIVTHVRTALPHQQVARQVFTAAGPLAFLPLAEANLCSIVWSLPDSQAQSMLALNDEQFKQSLEQAFARRLGEVTELHARYAFPLRLQKAKQYVQSRLALVGDAAHQVHPLAGQGVNMGLLDAASLAEVILSARAKQRDFASLATLRHYERWRKADNMGLLVGIEFIRKLFGSEDKWLKQMRGTGLNLTQHWRFMKNVFTQHAVGKRGDLPALAK